MEILEDLDLNNIFEGAQNDFVKLQSLCQYLRDNVEHYDWVGFYIVDPAKKVLKLGPFSGEPTEHKIIPYGKGVCGESAKKEQTIIVPNVAALDNYLSCSLMVKSEMVIPVFKDGRYMAQLDIDSHTLDAFEDQDRNYLEKLCSKLGVLFPLNTN